MPDYPKAAKALLDIFLLGDLGCATILGFSATKLPSSFEKTNAWSKLFPTLALGACLSFSSLPGIAGDLQLGIPWSNAELAQEITEKGQEVRKWVIPVEVTLLGNASVDSTRYLGIFLKDMEYRTGISIEISEAHQFEILFIDKKTSAPLSSMASFGGKEYEEILLQMSQKDKPCAGRINVSSM